MTNQKDVWGIEAYKSFKHEPLEWRLVAIQYTEREASIEKAKRKLRYPDTDFRVLEYMQDLPQ